MDIFEAEVARRFVVAVEKIANALDRKTESSSEKPNNCKDKPTGYNLSPVETEPQTEVDWKQRLCDMYGADRKSFDEAWGKYGEVDDE